ncbi:MAG: ABC transporter permease [Bacteroidota bacterium]|nr:ABC transporter permease [Bacteroidota bacterium]
MWRLLQFELFKTFKKPRTYISFGAIAAIVFLIQVALLINGKEYVQFILSSVDDTLIIPYAKITNGYWICFVILNLLLIHVPILVALVSGDIIAGEANAGTLRLLLTKPISRTKLMLVKFMACVVYTLILLIWMAFLALFVSMLLFGTNDLVVAREFELLQIQQADVLWRYFAAFGFAAVALITVAALSFLLSTISDNSIGPIVSTVSIIIILTILSEMKIPLYDNSIKPYIFTTHMLGWKGFFYIAADSNGQTIKGSIANLPAILKSLGILIFYIILFTASATFIFNRKDILT